MSAPLTLITITQPKDLDEILCDADPVSELAFEIDLERAISALTPRQALVVGLRLGTDPRGEHTNAEIAGISGLSESAVGRLYLAGLARLRTSLGSYRAGYAVAA